MSNSMGMARDDEWRYLSRPLKRNEGLTQFKGTLVLTDKEALLGQNSPGKLVVQTPILLDSMPPSGGSAQELMSAARAAFVAAGRSTGSSVIIEGNMRLLAPANLPVIVITSYP
jgi:hypothetical protein